MITPRGFTLIELLVVISIIGLLASIVLASIREAREKAEVTFAIREIQEVRNAIFLYHADTGQYPPKCVKPQSGNVGDPLGNNPPCAENEDPLRYDQGVPGWNGPYFNLWGLNHPWGGDIGIISNNDVFLDGGTDHIIIFNDDLYSGSDNAGPVPTDAAQAIDDTMDDGNLCTGEIRTWVTGCFQSPNCVAGELCIRYYEG